jgi:CheY-like chemotaxis protein
MTPDYISKPTIILADDDQEDLELLLYAFHQITDEHHLTAVESGKALLDLLAQKDDSELPCLIVMDYNMPGMNGLQTLILLQETERYNQIPKVIYSTSSMGGDRMKFMSIGARDYLVKPNSIREIVGSAQKMLDHCNTFLKPVV